MGKKMTGGDGFEYVGGQEGQSRAQMVSPLKPLGTLLLHSRKDLAGLQLTCDVL